MENKGTCNSLVSLYLPEVITTICGVLANCYPLQVEGLGRANTVKLAECKGWEATATETGIQAPHQTEPSVQLASRRPGERQVVSFG
jgi:hypothetical protein